VSHFTTTDTNVIDRIHTAHHPKTNGALNARTLRRRESRAYFFFLWTGVLDFCIISFCVCCDFFHGGYLSPNSERVRENYRIKQSNHLHHNDGKNAKNRRKCQL